MRQAILRCDAEVLGIGGMQVLQKTLPTYDIGMFEQNAMVYLLMQNQQLLDKVYFEHSYCFNCWYKDLDSPKIIPPAFVVHFAGQSPQVPLCSNCSCFSLERSQQVSFPACSQA